MNLDAAIVYDVETLPNVFTLHMEALFSDAQSTWEISEFRDDRTALLAWFDYCRSAAIPMVAFNSIHFDYPVIHYIYTNPTATVAQIYDKAQSVLKGDRFANTIWPSDRFAPQIDLFKIHHFDNKAKTTSLKALQINMRSPSVVDSPVVFGTHLTFDQVERDLIPYNKHDVTETKRFAHYSMKAIEFRCGLIDQFGVDALNFNDTKIGAKILEQRLGDDVCYTRTPRYDGDNYGRKTPRQTLRYRIALADVIFPYVQFTNPEFQRVLDYMRAQVLTPDDIEDPEAPIKTKGVFSALSAHVGGIDFHFGTGGIHGSVEAQRVVATDEWLIRDIDVEGLYPSIAIVNRLAPAHLGEAFIAAYASLPAERKLHAKGTVQNASFKLGANGAYGNSNNRFSTMYDPQFTMTITINGQLMLCMLAEWLTAVPTISLIQANTDGITYRIHRDYLDKAKAIEACWQEYTKLKLEDVFYSRMFLRDVNNYIAIDTKGKIKAKGAYWTPDPYNYAASISEASPPSWHKDLSNVASIRAAVAAMVHGIDPAVWLRSHTDPFDFMCRARATGDAKLVLGGQPVQRTCRYYVAVNGAPMVKISAPAGTPGAYKRKSGVTEAEYQRVMTATGGAWDESVCTKNRSTYDQRESAIEAGWNVALCNNASDFRFDNLNYAYYENEANKLIIR